MAVQTPRSGLWSSPSRRLLTYFARCACCSTVGECQQRLKHRLDWVAPAFSSDLGGSVYLWMNSEFQYKHTSIHKKRFVAPSLWQVDIYPLTVLYLQMVSFCTLDLCLYISCGLLYHSDTWTVRNSMCPLVLLKYTAKPYWSLIKGALNLGWAEDPPGQRVN